MVFLPVELGGVEVGLAWVEVSIYQNKYCFSFFVCLYENELLKCLPQIFRHQVQLFYSSLVLIFYIVQD